MHVIYLSQALSSSLLSKQRRRNQVGIYTVPEIFYTYRTCVQKETHWFWLNLVYESFSSEFTLHTKTLFDSKSWRLGPQCEQLAYVVNDLQQEAFAWFRNHFYLNVNLKQQE